MQIAENQIKKFRKQANLTLEELAKRANTTRSQVHKLERGERRLTVDWMMRLSQAMGCTPQDLLPADESANENNEASVMPSRAHKASNDDHISGATQLSIPVRGTVGTMMPEANTFSDSAKEYIPCPAFLQGVPGAFAVYMGDHSMQPKFKAGDLLYVKPSAPLTEGCAALVTLKSGQVYPALLEAQSSNAVQLKTLTPENMETVMQAEIECLERIVGAVEFSL